MLSADDNKSIKLTQHTRSYFGLLMCVYLLNKRMPDSKKYIHVYTKARIKTKKLAN